MKMTMSTTIMMTIIIIFTIISGSFLVKWTVSDLFLYILHATADNEGAPVISRPQV